MVLVKPGRQVRTTFYMRGFPCSVKITQISILSILLSGSTLVNIEWIFP